MASDKYVAYVSGYTIGSKDPYGIHIFDVDVKKGTMTEKGKVKISNSSYVTVSHNRKYLYSITDAGVESYVVESDGSLTFLNLASINGMRGCHMSTDFEDKYLFVAGYHDGKITVLRLAEDGSVGEITDEIYCKGLGYLAERNSGAHVNCVRMSRDNKYLFAVLMGMSHTNVYELDHVTGKLKLAEVIRSDQDSAPKSLKFSADGKTLYIMHEVNNFIDVYSYKDTENGPDFERIQRVSTRNASYHSAVAAGGAMTISDDRKYIVATNLGDNSVALFAIDKKTGMLEMKYCMPTSGEFPKDAFLFPDSKHLVVLNHESGNMTFFESHAEEGYTSMSSKSIPVSSPNHILMYKLGD